MNQQAKNFKKNPKAAVIKDNTSAQTEKTYVKHVQYY